MLIPTLTTLFSNPFMVYAQSIPVHPSNILYISLESPFPAPEHTRSVSILYHLGIFSCGSIPNLSLKVFAAVQYNSSIWLLCGVQVFPLYPQRGCSKSRNGEMRNWK